jgi:hypothetical protein
MIDTSLFRVLLHRLHPDRAIVTPTGAARQSLAATKAGAAQKISWRYHPTAPPEAQSPATAVSNIEML